VGVLNVGRLAPGAADYYCAEVARSPADYYAGRAEAPGRWVGTLAAEWGLAGLVGRDELAALLAGRHPRSGMVYMDVRQSQGRVLILAAFGLERDEALSIVRSGESQAFFRSEGKEE
jgi:hypothetical protein